MDKKAANKSEKARVLRKYRKEFKELLPEHLKGVPDSFTANSISNKDLQLLKDAYDSLKSELKRNKGGMARKTRMF